MGKLFQDLETLSDKNPNELDQTDSTMIEAITHLDRLSKDLCQLKGKQQSPQDYAKLIKPLLDCEEQSKKNPKSWRIVIDMATENGVYTKDPNIQICSGPPSYHRYIMNFENDGVKTKIETACVMKDPDLSVIHSQGSPSQVTRSLEDIRAFYDSAQIQRIAILGAARVFAHPVFIDPKKTELGQKEANQNQVLAQNYNKRVEKEMNKFLDAMEATGEHFLTVNGGWAGHQEQSTGIPLISSLIGAISDAGHDYSLPPITVMPEVGVFDRVTTRSDSYRTSPSLPVGEKNQDIHTFFEVPGGWGDDSKYLVGLSTGLMVFEPYGFWTNIEIANGVAQDKPVAIIADPENLKPGKLYYEAMKNGEKYAEITIPLPDNQTGTYRIYRDAGEATKWINDQSVKKMSEMSGSVESEVAKKAPETKSQSMKSELEQIKQTDERLENESNFGP